MTSTTRAAAPFDPRKELHDALLALKAESLAKLPQARGRRRVVVRKEVAACDWLLALFARIEQEART
jgi:hypothetical protein